VGLGFSFNISKDPIKVGYLEAFHIHFQVCDQIFLRKMETVGYSTDYLQARPSRTPPCNFNFELPKEITIAATDLSPASARSTPSE
jgi:hypothetical protein